MSDIEHFRTELKIKIKTLESEFDALAQRMACNERGSEEVVRNFVESLFRRVARKRLIPNTAAPHQQRGASLDARSGGMGSPWVVSTRSRALAAMDVACVALDEAAQAALEAWLAEQGEAAKAPRESLETRIATHER